MCAQQQVTLKMVQEAQERLAGVAQKTGLSYTNSVSHLSNSQVWLKLENLQRTGSFKLRGAYNKVAALSDEERSKGVIAASAGNHAQGVALAASVYGCQSTICMPKHAPLTKVAATKGYGADVVLYGDLFDDAYAKACELKDKYGYTFVHPFDDPGVATGQGSIAMEIFKEQPLVDYILVPVGGGGLATGVSTLTKLMHPKCKVVAVEPEGAACLTASFKAGKVVTLDTVSTIADGTAVKTPGTKIFPYLQKNIDDILTVPDNDLVMAFLDMVENHKMVVENSGLLTVAALKQLKCKNKKIVCILSGGNMDVITMSSVVQQGLIYRDRIFTVSVLLPDKPGELQKVAGVIAKENGNVIKLEHNQFVTTNRSAEVELRITLEAFGTEHKEQIIDTLEKNGFRPKIVRTTL